MTSQSKLIVLERANKVAQIARERPPAAMFGGREKAIGLPQDHSADTQYIAAEARSAELPCGGKRIFLVAAEIVADLIAQQPADGLVAGGPGPSPVSGHISQFQHFTSQFVDCAYRCRGALRALAPDRAARPPASKTT
jgi:hypothetical protein